MKKLKSEVLRNQYRLRFKYLEDYRNDVWRILCNDFFSTYIPEGSNVIDVGAGWGEFINNIKAAKKYAIDLNPETAKRLVPDVKFYHQDCSLEWPLESESLDIVFTSNFLEHLPDKSLVERTTAEAFRCLKDDGLIICMGPNIKYIPGVYWDYWDHMIPITEGSCQELLQLSGFDIETSLPRFLPYNMSSGRTAPLLLVKLYLQLPIFWRFLGKQFLVIGKKPAKSGRDVLPSET